MSGTNKKLMQIKKTGSTFVDSLLNSEAWADRIITYAFPTSTKNYDYNIGGRFFDHVSQQQKNAAVFAIDKSYASKANDGFSIEGFTNIAFKAGDKDSATLRFSVWQNLGNAYSVGVGTDSASGDIFFGTQLAHAFLGADFPGDPRTASSPGEFGWHAMLNLIGRSLGLIPLSLNMNNQIKMPSKTNSLEYTVMTFRTFEGDRELVYEYEQFGAPQTYMMADVAALQHIYGADYSTNSGKTVYAWNPEDGETRVNGKVAIDPTANRIFATIWDGGGKDTYDLSAYDSDLSIDLRPGVSGDTTNCPPDDMRN